MREGAKSYVSGYGLPYIDCDTGLETQFSTTRRVAMPVSQTFVCEKLASDSEEPSIVDVRTRGKVVEA